MTAPREPQLLDHEYDGIREFDNPTPGWWHMLFWGTILFSGVYAMFWHSSELAWTVQDSLRDDQSAYYAVLFKDLGDLDPDEPTMLKLMGDEKWMAFGGTIFTANCAQCHGGDGAGINGANLTDDHWINVKTLADVYTVITDGVAAKGMPTWRARLGQNERILVSAYVARLRGTPKPGRAAEGNVIPAWPTAPAALAPGRAGAGALASN